MDLRNADYLFNCYIDSIDKFVGWIQNFMNSNCLCFGWWYPTCMKVAIFTWNLSP